MTARIALATTLLAAAQVFVSPQAQAASSLENADIVLVLDRSGSMSGAMPDLKDAAHTFVSFFTDYQAVTRMSLVSFGTTVQINRSLGNNFVAAISTGISNMAASGYTNTSDAFAQLSGPKVFDLAQPTDRQRYVVFFSDGRPTAFRGSFLYRGVPYDGVAAVTGNCNSGDPVLDYLIEPASENRHVRLSDNSADVSVVPTGDGVGQCTWSGSQQYSTRWNVMDTHPVPGYGPTACSIPQAVLGSYMCEVTETLAIEQAEALKQRGIVIFAIGLGDISADFLSAIASPGNVYYTTDSATLESIFQNVAQLIIDTPTPAKTESFGRLKARYRR